MCTRALRLVITSKHGPIKVDPTGSDGNRKLDVEWNELTQKYVVEVRGGMTFHWAVTQFGTYFRKWLLRQREQPVRSKYSADARLP